MLLCGCDFENNRVPNKLKKYSASGGNSEHILNDAGDTITLTHECGVLLQPITEPVMCEFEIVNNSSESWKLSQIVNTCSCTVADITSPTIVPGQTEKVTVLYKPTGEGSFDDQRKSLVVFEEKEAPRFVLYVSSRVREQMTLRPKSLAWTRVGENQKKMDNFEVQNYSEGDWKTLEVSSKPQWLSVELQSVPPPQSEPAMRQLWLATTTADTVGLTTGEHRGDIVLTAINNHGETITQKCPVVLQITSAVSAIPAQFFFGNVKPNETVTKSIRIVFSPDAIPHNQSEIKFDHNLGDSLTLEWLNTDGDSWELQASLNVGDAVIPDEPMITMTFPNPSLPKLKFPVYVMMRANDTP